MMRFFTSELISAANGWNGESKEEETKANRRCEAVVKKYQRQLATLESRISRDAFRFFRYGFGSESLHDARLLTATFGDGLDYSSDGTQPFYLNKQPFVARIEFLNYAQDGRYVFDLRKVTRFNSDIFSTDLFAKSVGDLYTYELCAASDQELHIGFLFASGASITAQFRKLVFRRHRIKRQYGEGEMYR